MSLSFPILPMLLDKSDTVPKGPEYIHSLKIDGFRCLMHYTPSGIKLATRHLNDTTSAFPEMTSLKLNCQEALIDGELAILDPETAKPDFELTMSRFHTRGLKAAAYAKKMPAVFFAFDILQKDNVNLVHKPLEKRLEILQNVLIPNDHLTYVATYEDGEALFEATRNMGLEGIVSKRKNSPYLIGKRATQGEWVKVKNWIVATVEIIGLRKGEFGWALSKDGKYVGVCEFAPPEIRKSFWQVAKQIIKKEDKNYYWLDPIFKVKVKHIGKTKAGLLRTPSFVAFEFNQIG